MRDDPACMVSIQAWRARVESCERCPLHLTRTRAVTCSGPDNAAVMLVGEAPGATEDRTGLPFQGQSGRLLDAVLERLGMPRHMLHVSNAVRCRPPRNRPPTAVELSSCASHFEEELSIVDPQVVVTLGASAARALGVLAPTGRLKDIRGQVLNWRGRLLVATLHPSAALRSRHVALPEMEAELAAAFELVRTGGTGPG